MVTVPGHLSACLRSTQQESSRSGGQGGSHRERRGREKGEGADVPNSERLLCVGQELGYFRFVPTHGAVESDSLNSSDTSQASVEPPSATRGLPGPHF